MADVFLSYSKEDRPQASRLASALSELGWTVFWDRTIPPGLTWRKHIGAALEEARCVVVAWSGASVASDFVCEEADHGKGEGCLIPVFFEDVTPPLGFRGIQGADLSEWSGDVDALRKLGLVEGLERLLGSKPDEATRSRQEHPAEEAVFWQAVSLYNEHSALSAVAARVSTDRDLVAVAGRLPAKFLEKALRDRGDDQGVAMACAVVLRVRPEGDRERSTRILVSLLESPFERARYRAARSVEWRAQMGTWSSAEDVLILGALAVAADGESSPPVREALQDAKVAVLEAS